MKFKTIIPPTTKTGVENCESIITPIYPVASVVSKLQFLKSICSLSGIHSDWTGPNVSFVYLTPSLPECLMEFCKASLTFECADEILWCDHSNESSLPVLSYGAICLSKF